LIWIKPDRCSFLNGKSFFQHFCGFHLQVEGQRSAEIFRLKAEATNYGIWFLSALGQRASLVKAARLGECHQPLQTMAGA
jgi:hypothetical protein